MQSRLTMSSSALPSDESPTVPSSPSPDSPSGPKKAMDRVVNFLDENVTAIRLFAVWTPVLTAAFFISRCQPFVRVSSLKQIPDRFFKKRRRLRGYVTGVNTQDQIVSFYHTPFLRSVLWFDLTSKYRWCEEREVETAFVGESVVGLSNSGF